MPVAPYLLTPGPITTSLSVKEAMLLDWGSWDEDFKAMTAQLRHHLLLEANALDTHTCIPLQGSGTFAVEATLATVIPPEGKLLILINGAYGQRMTKICDYVGQSYVTLDMGDYLPPQPDAVKEMLKDDAEITHVAVVHCETSSGILNPIEAIAEVVEQERRSLIIDSMSAFGALPINAKTLKFDALVSSANKCFEGVPGFSYALIRQNILDQSEGNAHSLSLDLFDQWQYMEKTGQWRYTPPTHTVAAFIQALDEHVAEGGSAGRLARYRRNCDRMVSGMRSLGFETLLEDRWLSPIIVTFFSPEHENFEFGQFYNLLKQRGFIIYPGKLTEAESFRVGCIGRLFDEQINELLAAMVDALNIMDVSLVAEPA